MMSLHAIPRFHMHRCGGELPMASPQPVIRNGWSASTLLAGINCLDQDCLRAIKEELPDNPDELAKLHEVSPVFLGAFLGFARLTSTHT